MNFSYMHGEEITCDPAEANQTYRAASAIGAFDAIQVAFAALVKKGILSKAEAEQILMQAIETIKTGSTDDQAVALLPSCRLELGNLFQSDGEGEHGHLGDASHRPVIS